MKIKYDQYVPLLGAPADRFHDPRLRGGPKVWVSGWRLVSRGKDPICYEAHLWYVKSGQPFWFGRWRGDEYKYSTWNSSGERNEQRGEWEYGSFRWIPNASVEWDEEIPPAPWIARGVPFEEWWAELKPEEAESSR